jgi:hypothetical protein
VLEINTSAMRFYERMGGRNAGPTTYEMRGALVRAYRYVWSDPVALSAV